MDVSQFLTLPKEEYLQRMSRAGEWADHVVVQATAQILQRDIMIVTSSADSDPDNCICWVRGQPSDGGSDPILLGHVHENHYVALRPKGRIFLLQFNMI